MRVSLARLVAALAVGPAALAGCGSELPTSSQTVRLAIIGGAEHGGKPLSTQMTQEVTSTPVWAGDPNGTGSALLTVNHGKGEVCWELAVSDILLPATASHIHEAAPGIRGGIVVGLSAPGANGQSSGCRSDVDKDLLGRILQSPASFYVNVHTSDYPPGAIRGQLAR
jgi:hypothetical protein